MTKYVALIAISALAACSMVNGQPTIDTNAVQQDAVTVCGFLPAVETVTAIVSVGNPALLTADAIANAICAAVKPTAGARRPGLATSPVLVAGVPVKGAFVR